MENHVRIFREQPFGWFDKPVMRYLRGKYGKDKKKFLNIRSVYLALCEIESDFAGRPIRFFAKTVGEYAGLSREATGKYINVLIHEGLLRRRQLKDPRTKQFTGGTEVEILSLQDGRRPEKPMSGYPDIGVLQHRDTPTPNRKKISNNKKLNNVKNVKKKNVEEKENGERIDYYAGLIADKLGDRKSLAYYKLACRRFSPERLYQKAGEIIADGGAKNPAAVFVDWLKKEQPPPSG